MKKRLLKHLIFCEFSLVFLIAVCSNTWADRAFNDKSSVFLPLKERLIADGFDKKFIDRLYTHPGIRFLPQIVERYITYREGDLNYSQFLSPRSISMSHKYLRQYRIPLRKAHEQYGVSPEVIASLLLVETRLGRYVGNYPVLSVLSSLALSGMEKKSSLFQCVIAHHIDAEAKEVLKRKSEWAYAELKSFLRYVMRDNLDPFSIKGSLAGAFGIPQFVPSSLLKYGRDGDGDECVDLYNHYDTIMSVGNYLKCCGWKESLSRSQKEEILLRYNRSRYYAKTIMDLSERLTE
ncbi:MAG TPA: lytic murein transglycosylase [Syntrophaceae bacterium]|nr:lytic murein transglycosylase [Syntrophaceae bacterium]